MCWSMPVTDSPKTCVVFLLNVLQNGLKSHLETPNMQQ